VLTMEQIVSLKYRMKTDSIFLIGMWWEGDFFFFFFWTLRSDFILRW
jgi:hypothetical protein